MIKIVNMPMLIVTVSLFFPQILTAFIGWERVFHAPLFLSFAFLLLYLVQNNQTKLYQINKNFYTIILFQLLLLLFHILTGRGFVIMGAGGNLFLLSFILLQFLYIGKPELNKIIKGISFIYSFLVIVLFIELVIVIVGGQTMLSQVLPIYKTYNPSEVLQKFGIGGLNSMLGGSQIAGMVSLFSFLWFFVLYRDYAHFKAIGKELLLFLIVLSGFLYFITMTGTTTLLAVIAYVLFTRYYLKSKNSKILYLALFAVLLIISTLLFYNGLLFDRFATEKNIPLSHDARMMLFDFVSSGNTFFNSMDLDIYYFYAFHLLNAFILWLSQDWVSIIFGLGVQYIEIDTYISADNGFVFAVLLKSGLFAAVLLLAGLWSACYKPLITIKKTNIRLVHNWSRLGVIFSINAILFLVSTVHYNQALDNAGVYPLFALTIALSIYSVDERNRINNKYYS